MKTLILKLLLMTCLTSQAMASCYEEIKTDFEFAQNLNMNIDVLGTTLTAGGMITLGVVAVSPLNVIAIGAGGTLIVAAKTNHALAVKRRKDYVQLLAAIYDDNFAFDNSLQTLWYSDTNLDRSELMARKKQKFIQKIQRLNSTITESEIFNKVVELDKAHAFCPLRENTTVYRLKLKTYKDFAMQVTESIQDDRSSVVR